MRLVGVTLSALVSLVASLAPPAESPSALAAAANAMGGKERVLAVRTLIVEGSGELLYFGQTLTPYAKTTITLTAFRRSYDFANRRWLLDQTRESRYLTPMPPAMRVRIGLDGSVGYNIVGDGEMAPSTASVAAERAAEFVYHPIGFVQAAYAPGSQVSEDYDGGTRRIRLDIGGKSYAMRLDGRTSLPTRISRVVDHPMLGDVTLQVELSEWRAAGELTLPMRIQQRQDRWILSDYRITSARTNADPGNLAATDSVRAAAAPDAQAGEPAVAMAVEEIAPGIWLLDGPPLHGGDYHTVAIEQSDKIVLVEAPENDARTLAAIAKARELRPGKPLGPLVNTHHHFDHAGGVRAAISQGLTIITHEGNKDFYESVVYPRRHTIQPDALAKNPKPLKLTAVDGKLILRDSKRAIELYEVKGSPHSGSILIAYLPAERILIHADLDNPPGPNGEDPATPFTASLVETVQRLGLKVERVVGIHGRPVPWPTA